MKTVGMILVLLSCSGIGLVFSLMYKTRMEQLFEWKKGISLLKNEINFALTPLPEAFEHAGKRLKGEMHNFFNFISNKLKSSTHLTIENLDNDEIYNQLTETCLNTKDMEKISSFIKNLGLMDKESQVSHIELQIENLTQELETVQKEEEKNQKLYKTLGILAGVFIIVIFM